MLRLMNRGGLLGMCVAIMIGAVIVVLSSAIIARPSRGATAAVARPSVSAQLGTIRGKRILCVPNVLSRKHGRNGSHCAVFTARMSACTTNTAGKQVCQRLDRMVAINRRGHRAGSVPVKRGIYVMHLRPGSYKLEELWTARHTKPTVAAGMTQHVTVHAGHTVTVRFIGYAG
jgi:hypothetical protein